MSDIIKCKLEPKTDLIELFPYGVTMSVDQTRPVMIFKDESEKVVMPVWLSPLDAGIAMSQSSKNQNLGSPHNLTSKVFEALGLQLESCYFDELVGSIQYVKLHFKGSRKLKTLKIKADEAMSFCLKTDCKYFASHDLIEDCKLVQLEFDENQKMKKDLLRNRHPYLN